MDWKEYESNYLRIAKMHEKSDEYCIRQLEYAKSLFDKDLPIIFCPEHFCKLVGYKTEYVFSASNQPIKFYRTFFIEKKTGGSREINEPLPSLKEIQGWILNEILCHVEISPYAKAFIKGKSIKDNARFHKQQIKVLSMDIKDFFPSIGYGRVLHVFRQIGYRENVSVLLTNLCTLNNKLPQGAPTSPMLSNIIASKMDEKIAEHLGNRKIRFTRYADDLTFSGDFNEGDLIKNTQRIVSQNGFSINEKKTRIRKRNQRQEVTGVIVNEKIQVEKKIRRRIRMEIYYIKKYGLKSHLAHIGETRKNYLYHLIGVISYASFINPKDNSLKDYLVFLRGLLQ